MCKMQKSWFLPTATKECLCILLCKVKMKVMSLSLHSSRPWRPLFQNQRNVAGNPPPIDKLKESEDDMLKMIQLAKFKLVYNPFLNKLKDNTKCIKNKTYSSLLIEHRTFTKYVNIQPSIRTKYHKVLKKPQPNITWAIHSENKNIITGHRWQGGHHS